MADVAGYAAVFDKRSEDLGFREYVAPDALDRADMTDVLASRDHDDRLLLAHVKSGTLQLTVDAYGLRFQFSLADSPLAQDVAESVRRRDLSGASFAFTVAPGGDAWAVDERTGDVVRTITRIEAVHDVTLTPRPAYTQTSARLVQ